MDDTATDPLPYKVTIVCSKCGKENLVEAAVGGTLLAMALDRYFRDGCPTCTPVPFSGPAAPR